ncbi:unnamed protein product [Didymodactylos carnosus]|uniref:Uncharacterized protein n=1 Tax=Didymodactylos carnosus TaxID=1234261 RepID=A0A8S2D3E1_9BILA|nr:unnamed protein product [Didymodactylos carnosus]CAF3654509.1 unnamed protein product [Didymodactylos carnosus]
MPVWTLITDILLPIIKKPVIELDTHLKKTFQRHLKILLGLLICLTLTITTEIINTYKNESNTTAMLHNFKNSTTTENNVYTTLGILNIFILLIVTIFISSPLYGIIVFYISFMRGIETIYPIIDLINFILVYQQKMNQQYDVYINLIKNNTGIPISTSHFLFPSISLLISFGICIIRIILSFQIVHNEVEKYFNKKFLFICIDFYLQLQLFILGYSPLNPLMLLRKTVVFCLSVHLLVLFQDKTFWCGLTTSGAFWVYDKRSLLSKLVLKISKINFDMKYQLPGYMTACFIILCRCTIGIIFLSMMLSYSNDQTILMPPFNSHIKLCFYTLFNPGIMINGLFIILVVLFIYDGWNYWCYLDTKGVVWFYTGMNYLSTWKAGIRINLNNKKYSRKTVSTKTLNIDNSAFPMSKNPVLTDRISSPKLKLQHRNPLTMSLQSNQSEVTNLENDINENQSSSGSDTFNDIPKIVKPMTIVDEVSENQMNSNISKILIRFYDENNEVILLQPELITRKRNNNSQTNVDDVLLAKDQARFQLKEYDIVIMQLGNTGVGKSSLCQALTNNPGFRAGTLNGTTLVPRAGIIEKDNDLLFPSDKRIRYVIVDVPGLNQACVTETRNLYISQTNDVGQIIEEKLKLSHIERLIIDLSKLMTICLLVIDDKILNGFKVLYDKVIDMLVTGIKEGHIKKYANISDEELKLLVMKRIIIVCNKYDRLFDYENCEEQKHIIINDIEQVLDKKGIPIIFTVAASYSASNGFGQFTERKTNELKSPNYIQTINELKHVIHEKILEHKEDLIEQLKGQNRRTKVVQEAYKRGNERLIAKHQNNNRAISFLSTAPGIARTFYYRAKENEWLKSVTPNIAQTFYQRAKEIEKSWGINRNRVQMNKIVHEHKLTNFVGFNRNNQYICNICESQNDNGTLPHVWWYCEKKECFDIKNRWYNRIIGWPAVTSNDQQEIAEQNAEVISLQLVMRCDYEVTKVGWTETSWSTKDVDQPWNIIDELRAISKELNVSVAAVALRWIVQQPGVTSTIRGAKPLDQLNDNMQCVTFQLSDEQMARLTKVSDTPLPYPFNMIASFN